MKSNVNSGTASAACLWDHKAALSLKGGTGATVTQHTDSLSPGPGGEEQRGDNH